MAIFEMKISEYFSLMKHRTFYLIETDEKMSKNCVNALRSAKIPSGEFPLKADRSNMGIARSSNVSGS